MTSTQSNEQQPTVDFLSRGEAYGLPGQRVERLETHAAFVFLIADRAYKMKRAVRYSFLDFSSLAKRRQVIEAELSLNRRTAPELYRRVLPVTRDERGQLALDGSDPPIEWLLEMTRFDQSALLDNVAARHGLDDALLERLAEEIVAFHRAAEVRKDHGGAAGIRMVIEGNAQDLGSLAGEVLPEDAVAALNERTFAELEAHQALLEDGRRAGRVIYCHGDLHLGNIVLIGNRPVLFDCLEFDPELATIDVFYDLAFLLMDLCHRNLQPLAQRLLSGYLDATWDDAGTALLPLFLSVRAAIRAKVEGFTADLAEEAAERAALVATARAYLDLAAGFLAPRPPRLIAIGGVSGTGKTTLARRLAPAVGRAPGAVLLRSDTTRKKLCGVAADARLGPDAYDEQVSRRVYASLMARATSLLAAGQAVIVDAVMLGPADRSEVEQVARERGVRFDGLWLSAPAGTLAERVGARSGDASDATPEVVDAQLGVDPGALSWVTIESGGAPDQVGTAARAALGLSGPD